MLDEHLGVEPIVRRISGGTSLRDRYDMTSDKVCVVDEDGLAEGVLSIEEVEHMDEIHDFRSVSAEKTREIYTRTVSQLGIDSMHHDHVTDPKLRDEIMEMLRMHSPMWDASLGTITATDHRIDVESGTKPIRSMPL